MFDIQSLSLMIFWNGKLHHMTYDHVKLLSMVASYCHVIQTNDGMCHWFEGYYWSHCVDWINNVIMFTDIHTQDRKVFAYSDINIMCFDVVRWNDV